ncbi:monooxygenase [Heliocybe sulcata]|uniref:Monooxygenase n=1 Tax=Heliocybe sulcata TaxID=5364 RepID=A0A5C3MSE0_9AGAM|nr:monooxygenase [Heliocybe sulcata]
MTAAPAEVLIAGAGPAGLVLALTLAHNGIPVRIIDKLATPHVGQKGAGIQPRSLEVYKFLDVLPDILWEGRYSPPMRVYKLPGGTEPLKTWYLAEHSEPKPPTPYLNGIMLGQDHLESILRDHLARRGCHVEMATELLDFEQDSEKVVARIQKKADGNDLVETVNVKFLVGTDGAKGIVRKQLGLKFLGETRDDTHILIGDIQIHGLDNDHWHMWKNEKDEQVLLRPTERFDNVFTLMCGGDIDHAKMASDPKALIQWIKSVIQRDDLKFGGSFTWLSDFRPNIRMVDTFGKGRVFVAGDAAHVHSPTGGQGMNSSIQDCFNLGWKLALVCKGLSPLKLLTTYTEERLPVIQEMLQVTTKLLNKTVGQGVDQSAWKRGGALNQLGVNYRWSSIVLDERTSVKEVAQTVQAAYGQVVAGDGVEVIRAGDRAPDAPGLISRFPKSSSEHPTSLFQIFKPTFHTALIFTRHPEKAAAIAQFLQQALPPNSVYAVAIAPGTSGYGPHVHFEAVDSAFIDVHGYAYKHYGVESEEMTVVLVRPDGVVGAVVSSTDGLERYFQNIFV